MILRTPRRRVSPRTKRKFRAIKTFLRKALAGTSSQPRTKTTSSVQVSVSDLRSQITTTEQECNKDSKYCRDLACLDLSLRKESESSVAQFQRNERSINQQVIFDTDVNDIESKILHKSSNSQHRKSNKKQNTVNSNQYDDDNMTTTSQNVTQSIPDLQFKQKKNEFRKINRAENVTDLKNQRRTNSKYNTIEPIYSTSTFHSLVESRNNHDPKPGCSSYHHEKRHTKKEIREPLLLKERREREQKDLRNYERATGDRHHKKRTKRVYSEVDKDFIDEIIKNQYRPVKLLGRRDSDFSQFSAPVCRDQEFTVRHEIQGVELCSCCECRKQRHRYARHTGFSDMRSVCDTRLYSSKKQRRYKKLEKNVDDYNNAAIYDVVPVKEKSSPKSRRKFAVDNMIAYQCSKEVPPSPRSHRPRLNLKVQHADYEDCLNNGRNTPMREYGNIPSNVIESDTSSVFYTQRKQPKIVNRGISPQIPVQILEDVGTMSSLHDPNFTNEQNNIPYNDITLNTQSSDSTADKTKTLCEIKEMLRSFLLEIKKESTDTGDGSDGTMKIKNKYPSQNQLTKVNPHTLPNSGHSFNNYGQHSIPPFPANQCMPAFPSPCCFPILPICPTSCMQNGYIVSNPSQTCNVCAKTSKEQECLDKNCCHKSNSSQEINTNNETQELIKEIYKLVSQKSKTPRNTEQNGNDIMSAKLKNERLFDRKLLTGKNLGESDKSCKHDANVGTPQLKYYSKSCEAIVSRTLSETQNTNASFSDTVVERLNLETTQSSTETEISTDVPKEKVKRGKLRKVLNPWRLFKKKKKDVIEEISETESNVEENRKPRPFKQHIQSYAMHGQEYYHQPPMPGRQCCVSPRYDCCGPPYELKTIYQIPYHDFYNHHSHHHGYSPTQHYNPNYPTTSPHPNYDHHNHPPQVSLCLKEIEVKSIGIQSERKLSIFKKLMQKKPVQNQEQEANNKNAPNEKTNFWKSLQEKSKQTDNYFKMQKQHAQYDMNIKNAMMKKLFYKRNPFSPRNLIVKTLLGKDKFSYGNPPKIYKPRMFL